MRVLEHEHGLRARRELGEAAVAHDRNRVALRAAPTRLPPAPTTSTASSGSRSAISAACPIWASVFPALMPSSVATTSVSAPGSASPRERRQRARLLVQGLHPDEDAVASRPPHRWQAGDVAHPLVVEVAHRLPVARLGAQADLAKRVTPPLLEAVAPALVVPVASRAAAGGERGGRRELGERSGGPAPHDEVHHERIVLGLHPLSVSRGAARLS